MMLSKSVVTFFCDDIRHEKMGMDTLIGIYPDNVNVPSFPYSFPKLGIYTRINIDVLDSIDRISIYISTPNMNNDLLSEIEEESITKSQKEAKKNNSPIVGIISKAISSPFTIGRTGQIKITVVMQGVEYVGGVLNVRQIP